MLQLLFQREDCQFCPLSLCNLFPFACETLSETCVVAEHMRRPIISYSWLLCLYHQRCSFSNDTGLSRQRKLHSIPFFNFFFLQLFNNREERTLLAAAAWSESRSLSHFHFAECFLETLKLLLSLFCLFVGALVFLAPSMVSPGSFL